MTSKLPLNSVEIDAIDFLLSTLSRQRQKTSPRGNLNVRTIGGSLRCVRHAVWGSHPRVAYVPSIVFIHFCAHQMAQHTRKALCPTYMIHVHIKYPFHIHNRVIKRGTLKMNQNLALRGDCMAPHSFTPVGGRFGRVEALPFNLVEQDSLIEVVARFTENVKPRFGEFFCEGFEGDAVSIWLEERKSENEDMVGGVKVGRGLPTSGELRGLSIGVLAQSYTISASQRTNSILPDFIVVRSKEVPRSTWRIDCIHRS